MRAQGAAVLLALVLVLGVAVHVAGAAGTRIPARWKNCTVVNKRFPHGVGTIGARDRTSGEPVTNFSRSTYLYRLAMRYNRGLDRDHDGIACEELRHALLRPRPTPEDPAERPCLAQPGSGCPSETKLDNAVADFEAFGGSGCKTG